MNVDEMKALSLRAGRIMCVADCVYTGWHVHGLACTRAGIATASRCAQHNRAECSSGCRYVTACVIAGT
jgi:hypothetical protein